MKSYLFVLLTVLAVIINYTYAEDKEICDLSLISKCCSTCTPITYREYGVEEGEWCSISYYCDEEIRYNLIIDLKDEKDLQIFYYTTKYSVNIKVDPSSEYKWDYQIEDTEIVQFVSKNITDNGTIERFLFVGNNVGDTKVNFTLHSLVDQEDQIQATLTYSFSVRKRFDVNKFPMIKYRKNKEIVIEEGTTYELGVFSENGVPGWSFVNSNDTVIKERKEYNKRYISDRNAVGGGYSWVELIEGKNIGTSKFFTIFYPYSPPFSVVEFPFRVVSAKDKCFTSTNNLGYPCCEGCEILYTDDDGDWGVENEDWCGIPYHCATDITVDKKLTVPQCSTIELPIENTFNTAFSIYNSTVIDEIITYPNRTVFAGINLGKTIIRKSENNKIEKYEITVTESDESSIEETFHIKKYTRKALTFDSKYSSSYSYGWNVKIENSEIISTIQNYYSTSNEPIDQYKFVITGKNIGTSYIDFIYNFETDVDLIKKRYVIVVDEEGGDEDDEVFSGCWAEPLGYPCCTKETEIVYMDEDGNWGVENDDWY